VSAPRLERTLAAVLAADVVGYSRLMEQDEGGTFERLKAHRKEIIEPLIAQYRGRIVKLTGDGALCDFHSVVDAVACAILIHQAMTERERNRPEAERIRFRIGINLGDVIREEDGDLYGDGVNIAARLEGLADPGGICISGTAYDHLGGKVDCASSTSASAPSRTSSGRCGCIGLSWAMRPRPRVRPRRRCPSGRRLPSCRSTA
jgi:adenylate cyclase